MGSFSSSSFPASGPYAVAAAPDAATGGMSSVTQVTNVVNTSWASEAVQNATSSSDSCCATCSILGSSSPSPLTSSENNFNLAGAGQAMGAVSGGMSSAAQSLGIVVALQSITGGVAEMGYNMATTLTGLIQSAIGANDPTQSASLLRLATSLASTTGSSSPLFSGAFGMASAGLLAGGDASIGRLLSGSLGSLQALVPGANLLGSVPPSLASLSPASSALQESISSAGVGSCVIPPSITSSDLASQYPAGLTSGMPGQGVSGGLSALAAQLTSAVDSLVGSVIGDAVTAFPVLSGRPNPGTGARAQGLPIVDGESQYSPPPAPAASASGTGALDTSGTSNSATPGSSLAGNGASAPSAGDIAEAAFSSVASGGADFASLLGSGLSAGVSLLADACAGASALASLLGAAVSAIEAAAAIPAEALSALEAMLASLESQAASYLASLCAAYAAAEAALARLESLLNANTVIGLLEGIVASACMSGSSASASSLVGVI